MRLSGRERSRAIGADIAEEVPRVPALVGESARLRLFERIASERARLNTSPP